ncbi:MAG: integrase family protein [Burkholderiales bacterium]
MACPPGKDQVFVRDIEGNGLKVRVSPSGAKTFVFEQRLSGRTIRKAIGSVDAWSIPDARAEAKRLSLLLDGGVDPREVERQQAAEKAAARAAAEAQAAALAAHAAADALTVGEAWARYIAERRPHWVERTYTDHLKIAQEGGKPRERLPGVLTKPGPLAAFMPLRLVDRDAAAVEAWAAHEAKNRPARVRLALRLLKAFMRWAAAEPDLKGRADPTAASAKKARGAAGKPKAKDDVLLREQLPVWFGHVRTIPNPVISTYLQGLLLVGCRREELAGLKWNDINWQWKSLSIRDKVDGERVIPLTPYLASLLAALPRRNEWVFSSPTSASGGLREPSIAHRRACAAAGLEGLTLHGLRRSFASLTEWLEIPAGVVAQIQGHKPSATAEKHYKRRPLDLLRVHHERIEAWVLEHAGIAFDPKTATAGLRVVSGA